jgi:hypothetical protein
MPTIKTAISLQQSLFDQVDALAHEMDISRSRLFALAAQDYIDRFYNRQLLEAINDAYDDLPDPDEEMLHRKIRQRQRHIVGGQW